MELKFEEGKAPVSDTIGARQDDSKVWEFVKKNSYFPHVIVKGFEVFVIGHYSLVGVRYAYYSRIERPLFIVR